MNIQELKKTSSEELIAKAEKLEIENPSTLRKQEILFAILKNLQTIKKKLLQVEFWRFYKMAFGFLRAIESNYLPGPDDIYVSPSQIRRFGLRTGDSVEGQVRSPKNGERYFALLKVEQINFESPKKEKIKLHLII
jgi:transcription termination factor Rho